MRRVALTCAVLALAAAPSAGAQAASRFFNLVDTPAVVTYGRGGSARVQLDPAVGAIINVAGYRKVSVLIGSTQATSSEILIGKISNATLAQRFNVPLDQQIHTFDIVGPELVLWLVGGPPGTSEKVQLWVFLSE